MSPRFWLDTLALLFSSPWKHRALILQMVRREVVGRYRGSVMGLLWSFLNPILMLAVYTFVFSEVFKAKWGVGSNESKADFALILFVGLIVHGVFAECVNRAPGLILSNVNFVKKVVFPLEILPWVAMGATLFHAAVSVGVWALFFVIIKGYLPWTIVFLPLVALPLVLGTLGFRLVPRGNRCLSARCFPDHGHLHHGAPFRIADLSIRRRRYPRDTAGSSTSIRSRF